MFRDILIFAILLFFFSCDENSKERVLMSSEKINTDVKEDRRPNKDLFNIVKIDSVQNFYIIYAKKKGNDYKIVSEKIETINNCKKIKTGNYLSLILKSIVPDTSKISYKIGGILHKGVEFDFESDSIMDIYESKNFIGLCYSENVFIGKD